MRMHRLSFHILALGLTGASLAGDREPAGFDSSLYQYHREIKGTPTGTGLGTVVLDPEIYRHSGPDHGKLRLVKQDGEKFTELPWIVAPVEPPDTSAGERRIPHRIESFDENEDGSIELTVALTGETPPPARLEILTPLRDFEKSVTVSTSADGTAWSPLVSGALVFDFERFIDFRRTSLVIPESPSRHFKVRIADASDQQRSLVKELSRTVSEASGVTIRESGVVTTRLFRIDEIRFFTAAARREENGNKQFHDLEILEQHQDPATKRTGILIDGGGLPIHEMTLTATGRNFRREVSVQVPDKTIADGWRTIHHGSVHSYHVGEFHDERLSLTFTEERSARYRLLIENEDSPPLTIAAVSGRGETYELLFLAGAGDRLSLFLGSPSETMTKPRFDTAAIVAAGNEKVARERFVLGFLEKNAAFSDGFRSDSRLFESKILLWVVIALVVALLIVVLYRTMQRVEAVEDDN